MGNFIIHLMSMDAFANGDIDKSLCGTLQSRSGYALRKGGAGCAVVWVRVDQRNATNPGFRRFCKSCLRSANKAGA